MLEALILSNFITLLFGSLLALTNARKNTFLFIAISCVLLQSVIIGLRNPDMMTDTREYARLFKGTSGFEDRIEPVFMALIYTLQRITGSVTGFLICLATLINFIYFSIIYVIFGRYALLVFGLFSSSFSYWLIHVQVIRSGLASILLLLAMTLILNKKLRNGLVVFVLALGNHFSIAVISVGAFLGYTLSKLNFRRFFGIIALMIVVYAIYEYALPVVPALAPWKQRLDAYAYYNEMLFMSSSFGYTYVYLVCIIFTYPILLRDKSDPIRTLFFVYIGVAALSFAFWFNILFRDRIFLFAQLLEPILLSKVFLDGLGKRTGAVLGLIFGCLASVFVIYVWGPRTVLIF